MNILMFRALSETTSAKQPLADENSETHKSIAVNRNSAMQLAEAISKYDICKAICYLSANLK